MTLFLAFVITWLLILVAGGVRLKTLRRIESSVYQLQSTIKKLEAKIMAKFDDLSAQVSALNDGLTAVMAAVTESGTDIDTILENVNPVGGLTEAEATALVDQIAAVQVKQAEALAQAQAVAAKFPVLPPPA